MFHANANCSGLSVKNYDILNSHHILYICTECTDNERRMTNEVDEVKDALNNKLKEVEKSLADTFQEKIDYIVDRIEGKVDNAGTEMYAIKLKGK